MGPQLPSGTLGPIAARVCMKTLYGARYACPDLLRAIQMLARKFTKWTVLEDEKLHRLVCYFANALDFREIGWLGLDDKLEDLVWNLYTDADLASDPTDHVSTSGVHLAVEGPNTR